MVEGLEPSLFLAHIKGLFDEHGLSYKLYKIDIMELMEFSITNSDGQEILLFANATPDDRWLFIFGQIGNLGDYKSKKQVDLIEALMRQNMDTLGVKIALNDENDIVLMTGTNNTNITYDELDEIIDYINFASSEVVSLLKEY